MSSTPSTSPDRASSHANSRTGDDKLGSDKLSNGLKVRHLTMMGLGSTIGAGLFLSLIHI